MRHINNLFVKLTALLVIAGTVKATGQPVTNAFYCSTELTHLKMAFSDTAHVSFQADYIITFNDATKDTVHYQYKVSGDKAYQEASDSSAFIQNKMYNLVLDHKQHRAVVSRPVDVFKYLIQVNITGLSFYQSFVSGRAVADSGAYKKLSYFFKAASPYRTYDIIYDTTTYRLHAIQYSFNMAGSGSAPSGSKMPFYVTILFSNYQTGLFTDNVFSTNGYFTRKQGICNMVAPYTSYQLINSLNQ
jgi:hypothetical protein